MAYAIILAAGQGTRMGVHDVPKAFILVRGKALFCYSLESLSACPCVEQIVLVVPKGLTTKARVEVGRRGSGQKKVHCMEGGASRQESVRLALEYLSTIAHNDDIVLVHDSARPFVEQETVEGLVAMAASMGSAMACYPIKDTIIESHEDKVHSIPDRSSLLAESTPSAFRLSILLRAHVKALEEKVGESTDDARLVMAMGQEVGIVLTSPDSFKVTYESDLDLMETILAHRADR